MSNGIDKKALFKLKSEPYLKPISDLGVGFYNLDENTAILRFQLSNTKGPLLIHENNLTAYAYFESSNGSVSDVIELEIEDSFNGIVTITLDKDFLQASTSTKVKGQVYIGVNNVDGNPEYNEVAVFREFTFEVADALINKISSFTKIEYIRMFDQLKMRIEQKVKDIEEAIANGADYVAEMKSVLQQGIETLNAIVSNGEQDIQTAINQAKGDLTKVRDGATSDINTVSNNAKTSVQDTASTAINSINTKTTEATEHVDSKVTEFNQTVAENGFLSPQILDEEIGKLDWQKYKLTDDNGHFLTLNDLDLYNDDVINSLKPGSYYYYGSTGPANGGMLQVFHNLGGSVRKYIIYDYRSNKIFINGYREAENRTFGWEEINTKVSDTGWVPFNLINGAKTNTAYKNEGDGGFDCAYRTITNGSEVTKKLRINGTNLTPNQVIAQLPSNFAKNAQAFPVRVPNSSAGGYVVIRPSGRVNFYISGDSSNWTETGYAYGECTWHD